MCALSSACTDRDTGGADTDDAGDDVGIDTVGDGGADVGDTDPADTSDTVEPDATPDADPDAEPDAIEDASGDATEDADPDVTPDADPDVTPDAEPDVIEPTCVDGVQNGGETGVDCGGPCDPCPTYGVDCSGGGGEACFAPYRCDAVGDICVGTPVREIDILPIGVGGAWVQRGQIAAFREVAVAAVPGSGGATESTLYQDVSGDPTPAADLTDAVAIAHGGAVGVVNDVAVVAADGWNALGTVREAPGRVDVWTRRPMAGAWELDATIVSPSPRASERFGAAVAAGRQWVIVGSPSPGGGSVGRVYVFSVTRGGPESASVEHEATLLAPNGLDEGSFGSSVSLRGGVLAVGAPEANDGAGAVWIFEETALGFFPAGGMDTEVGVVLPEAVEGDRIGTSVSVDPMGRVAFGVPGRDAIAVLTRDDTLVWGGTPTVLVWPEALGEDPDVPIGTHVSIVGGRIASSRVGSRASDSSILVWGLHDADGRWLPSIRLGENRLENPEDAYAGAVAVTGSRVYALVDSADDGQRLFDFSLCSRSAPGGFCEDSCSDGVRGMWETDVDCGGEACSACAEGERCVESEDCGAGLRCDGTTGRCVTLDRP